MVRTIVTIRKLIPKAPASEESRCSNRRPSPPLGFSYPVRPKKILIVNPPARIFVLNNPSIFPCSSTGSNSVPVQLKIPSSSVFVSSKICATTEDQESSPLSVCNSPVPVFKSDAISVDDMASYTTGPFPAVGSKPAA